MKINSSVDEAAGKALVKLSGEMDVNVVTKFKKEMDTVAENCKNIIHQV